MFQDVLGLLGRFGLKDTDGKVFLTLLHFREGLFVHEIVTHSKIKRSTVDLVLDRLIADGYVTHIKFGKRFKYFAKSPESILFHKEQSLLDFKSLLPMLARLGSDKGETRINFFEGPEGIRRAHQEILLQLKNADNKELLSFSSGEHVMRVFPDMQTAFINKRIKMGAWFKAIAPASSRKVPEWTDDPKSLRAVRYIDDRKFSFKVQLEIFADSVMIYSPMKPVGGIVIENPRIADSLRSLFHFVWETLA